ncbi:MAG: IclR family transcriptional regulator [Phycisphaerales bacterium JB039]
MTTKAPDAKQPRYAAPALEKGLDILELLADQPQGLPQVEIARRLNRTVGEIFRMLNCLVRRQYVGVESGDRYALTLKLFELGHRSAPTRQLAAHAAPVMLRYAEASGQSCHLTVTERGRGVVIAQQDNLGEFGFAVRVGSEMELLSTASGRVLLAFAPDEERRQMLSGIQIDDMEAVRARLGAIAQRGYEEMESTRVRGVHDISFPVRDHRAVAVAALTSPFVARLDASERATLDQARTLLRDAAAELAASLGAGAAAGPEAGA